MKFYHLSTLWDAAAARKWTEQKCLTTIFDSSEGRKCIRLLVFRKFGYSKLLLKNEFWILQKFLLNIQHSNKYSGWMCARERERELIKYIMYNVYCIVYIYNLLKSSAESRWLLLAVSGREGEGGEMEGRGREGCWIIN